MSVGYVVKTATAATALVGGAAKTIANVIAGTRGPVICELSAGFDGVTASAVPVLVELCGCTQGAAGTPGTSPTPAPIRPLGGDAAIATAGESYSAEPTTVTPIKHWLVTPNGGLLVIQFPLGREQVGTIAGASAGKGQLLRCNAPANVNVRGYLEFEE